MKKHIPIVILFCILFSASCNRGKKLNDYGEKFAEIMKSESALFRGNNLGDDLYPVYENESPKNLSQEESDYLFYEIKNDSGELYSIEYNFNENKKLADIRFDGYFTEKSTARTVFENFKTYFTETYGNTEDAYGYAIWKLKDSTTIELADESSEYKQGKITILFYRK